MKLSDCHTLVDLARCIKTDSLTLNKAFHKRKYSIFKIPKKKKGEFRVIEDPYGDLEIVQKRLARVLNNEYAEYLLPNVHGYIPKRIVLDGSRDIFSNASAHRSNAYVLNVDIQDFFHSISKKRIKKSLQSTYSFSEHTASYIAKIGSYKKRLPMGSSLSPVLSNMMSYGMDVKLAALAIDHDLIYTRYVDDMTSQVNLTLWISVLRSFLKQYLRKAFKLMNQN